MPSRIRNLVAASFRGVTFSVRTESQPEGGRKIVLHEYPNSSMRYVEDLGQIPPRFRLTAYVHGDNWQARGAALEGALNREGIGRLIMPTLGSFDVYALPYRKDASQTSIGIFSYELEFAVGSANVAPSAATSTEETVYANGDAARQAIQGVFETIWSPPIQNSNKRVAQFDTTQAMDTLQSLFKDSASASTVREFTESADGVVSDIGRNIRNSKTFSEQMIYGTGDSLGVWQALSLSQNLGAGYKSAMNMTTWGSDLTLQLGDVFRSSAQNNPTYATSGNRSIPLWPSSTAERIKRNKNRTALVDTTRVNALVVAYEQAASSDFQTQDDVISVREELETAYSQLIIEDGADNTRLVGKPDVRNSVDALRYSALEVLAEKQQNAYQIVSVDDAGMVAIPVLTYSLYAENIKNSSTLSDRTGVIRKLNPSKSAVNINGSAQVLREA